MFSLLFKEFGQPLPYVLTAKVSLSHEIRLDWNSKVISTPTTEPICLLWYSFTPGTYFNHLSPLATITNIQPPSISAVLGILFNLFSDIFLVSHQIILYGR